MAESNIPQQVSSKPAEKVFISSPYTARVVEQAKRLDRIVRRADERYGRGQMTESRYEDIRSRCRVMVARIEKDVSDMDDGGRARASGKRNQRSNGSAKTLPAKDPKTPNKDQTAAAPKAEQTEAKKKAKEPAKSVKAKVETTADKPTTSSAKESAMPAESPSASNSSQATSSPGF